ncbi:DNA/RNA non-specific endonuclease [Actinomyces wuliandei]|uniref:DNA/RNA non-specific endonuclease n=1 Tax=Actinomyces wuliandei TaxID=2057743 RepID=UPI001118E65B|nr:DNA/RNA non-specific endonuclease [Actinomyces wuliandei]
MAPTARKPFGRGVELEPNTCYQVDKRGSFYTDESGVVVHVEAHSAVERRGWLGITQDALNPDLKDPLPSATYTVDGRFHYTTDEWSRTVRIQVDELRKVDGDLEKYRSESVQERVGKYGGEGYDGGHLSGHQFGGAPEDINVVPMRRTLNQGTEGRYLDSYKKLEDDIAKNPTAYESIDIYIEYDGPPEAPSGTSLSGVPKTDRVPTEFRVSWVDEQGTRTVPRRFVNE